MHALRAANYLRTLSKQLSPTSSLIRPLQFLSIRHASAEKIDGRKCAKDITKEVAAEVSELTYEFGEMGKPGLAVVLIGSRPDSATYVKMKDEMATKCGFRSIKKELPEDASEDDIVELVKELNVDPTVDGILVQLPLPDHVDQKRVLGCISVHRDVDGFHPANMGALARAGEELRQKKDGTEFSYRVSANTACTPLGCLELLDRSGTDLNGANVVVIGRSNIVGLPVSMMLLHRDATVTLCHSRTKNLPDVVRAADVVVAAIGSPEFVKSDWIKEGAVVIDVGVNFKDVESKKTPGKMIKKMCGDVDEAAAENASFITPVPGGVGPMTIAMLMRNTLENAKSRVALECHDA